MEKWWCEMQNLKVYRKYWHEVETDEWRHTRGAPGSIFEDGSRFQWTSISSLKPFQSHLISSALQSHCRCYHHHPLTDWHSFWHWWHRKSQAPSPCSGWCPSPPRASSRPPLACSLSVYVACLLTWALVDMAIYICLSICTATSSHLLQSGSSCSILGLCFSSLGNWINS